MVIGITQLTQGGVPVLFVLGLAVAAYSWLTTPRQYLIYRDALVIRYGNPRVRAVAFAQIANLETLSLPMGERLRVRMTDGKRMFLMTKDPDTFRQRLEEALGGYHGDQGGGDWVESRGALVEDRPLNTVGTPFSTEGPAYSDAPEEPAYEAPSGEAPPFDAEPSVPGPAPEPADDPRGPVTPYGNPLAPDEEPKTPY